MPKIKYDKKIRNKIVPREIEITEDEQNILQFIREDPAIAQAELAEKLSISVTTLKKRLNELIAKDVLKKEGSTSDTKYLIV